MFPKKLFTLVAWYVAWNIISTYFSKNKSEKLKKDLKTSKDSKEQTFKILFDNFCETHKNLLDSIKKEVLTEKNISYINEKKADLYKLVEEYKNEWEKILENMNESSTDTMQFTKEKLENLYNSKKKQIEDLKEKAPEKIEKAKNSLLDLFNKFNKLLKK